MNPARAAWEAWCKAMGTDHIRPHPLAKEVYPYSVAWDQLPAFARTAWEAAAKAARDAR